MSLESWKAEFYPKPANIVPESGAVSHSLKKWIGLRPENLEKHRVRKVLQSVADGFRRISIDGDSCALCMHYLLTINGSSSTPCEFCPLGKHLGRACDRGISAPYGIWARTGNPEPMIAALTAILPKEQP